MKSLEELIEAYGTKDFNRLESCAFPDDFYRYNGVDIDEEQINEWIYELKKMKCDTAYISSGDTIVIKYYDEFIVAKNYWEVDTQEGRCEC